MTSSSKDNEDFSCCYSTWFRFPSEYPYYFLEEYKLDAEGISSDKTSQPYKRHLHVVEGLIGKNKKVVHVTDIVTAKWMLGMWRNTRTRAAFLNGVCVWNMLQNYVTNDSGTHLFNLPISMTTRGLGKIWSQNSMHLTSKALEMMHRLNPTAKKSTDLPVSVLSPESVYPVILPHPSLFLPVKDSKQAVSKITIVMGTIYKRNTAHTKWRLPQVTIRRDEKKVQFKVEREEFCRCLCCCCAKKKSEEK